MLALLSFSASFNAPTASMLGRSSFVAQASPVTLSRALAPRAAITMDEVEDKVKSIIAEQLGVEASSVTPDASFTEDLGADSLDAPSSRSRAHTRALGPNDYSRGPRGGTHTQPRCRPWPSRERCRPSWSWTRTIP